MRPEHLHEGPGDGLALEAEVEAVEHLGESSTIYLTRPGGERIAMRAPGTVRHAPGERVVVGAPVEISTNR